MNKNLTPIIEQFSIINGAWQRKPHNQAAVREPKNLEIPKGNLFVLVEAQGKVTNIDAVEKRLVALVRDNYYPTKGGITSGLRRAFQTANQWLYEQNATVSADKIVVGGAIALALREEDLFVAQIGPTALFTNLNRFVTRYPKSSTWLDMTMMPHNDYSPALGLDSFAEPLITHLQIEAGDVLVLADGRLAGQLPLEAVSEAVNGHKISTISKNLAKISQAKHCSALVIQIDGKQNGARPLVNLVKRISVPVENPLGKKEKEIIQKPIIAPPIKTKKKPVPVNDKSKTTKTNEKKKTTRAIAESENKFAFSLTSVLQKQNPEPYAPSTKKIQPEPSTIIPPSYDEAEEETSYDDADYFRASYDDDEQPTIDNAQTAPAIEPSLHPPRPIAKLWNSVSKSIISFIALLGTGLHTILKLVLPSSEAEEAAQPQAGLQAQPIAHKKPSYQALKYVAIALPIVVILITFLMYTYQNYSTENEYSLLIEQAEQNYEQSQVSVPEIANTLLDEAEQHLGNAALIKPDQPEIASLQSNLEEERDKINGVQRLYYIPELQHYTTPGTRLDKIIVQGVQVYILDAGLGRVFHHTLDDIGDSLLPDTDSAVLAMQGEQIDSTIINQIVDLVWMPSGGGRQTSDLLVVHKSGLLEFNPNWGASAIPLYGMEQWQMPVAAGSYFGNFYILDQQSHQIYRYLPSAAGYENPAEPYFASDLTINLGGAVDMAIDGAIYVLHQDGRIQKFLSGEPTEFTITGLLKPFNNPTAIFTAPDELVQYIYVADAGNQRIVQLSKQGEFIREFQPRTGDGIVFNDLRSIYVDEIGQKMYILNKNSLYAPNISSQ